jgi:hypothetical protein
MVVDAIAGLLSNAKDRALVAHRDRPSDLSQDQDPAYALKNRGLFGKLSLTRDAEGRLPLSRANHPEVIHAMCRYGADPRDDGYNYADKESNKFPKPGIYPAICYAQNPEVYAALVACMGPQVQVNAYHAEHAATPLTLRLMSRNHPQAMSHATESGGHASLLIHSVFERPTTGGMIVSHFKDPEMTKAALLGMAQHLSQSGAAGAGQDGISPIREVIDRGTLSCNPSGDAACSMPLRCPSLESAKMLCAWRCIHATDDADWLAWSANLKRDLDNRADFRANFRGRGELKTFVDVLTATRSMLLQ